MEKNSKEIVNNVTSKENIKNVGNEINKTVATVKTEFDSTYKLVHDIFFASLQIFVSILLFIGIINLTKYEANDIYPVDLHSKFYGDDDKCDLGKLYAGETRFCNESYTSIDVEPIAGKSLFGRKLETYVKNMGYLSADSFSIILLWLNYIAFNCEHFSQTILNATHEFTKKITGMGFIANLFFFLIIASFIKLLNNNAIQPFLEEKFKIYLSDRDIFKELTGKLCIYVGCIILLLFLFLLIPVTFYYIFAICVLLLENLSIQMNLLCIFAIYTSFSTFKLFIQLIINNSKNFNKDSINQLSDKVDYNKLTQNDKLNKDVTTSYLLFFIIPIIVSIGKLSQLIRSLFSNISFKIDRASGLVFLAITLMSFYDIIKKNLDSNPKLFNFPFSIIYAVTSIVSVIFLYYKKPKQIQPNANVADATVPK